MVPLDVKFDDDYADMDFSSIYQASYILKVKKQVPGILAQIE